jgi:hypothetical protein
MTSSRLAVVIGGIALASLLVFLVLLWSGGGIREAVLADHGVNVATNASAPVTSIPQPSTPQPIPLPSGTPGSAHDVVEEPTPPESPAQAELSLPLFYRIPMASVGSLPADQQFTILNLQKEYLTFFEEWNRAPGKDAEVWNQKMSDLHEKMVMKLGPETVDALVK